MGTHKFGVTVIDFNSCASKLSGVGTTLFGINTLGIFGSKLVIDCCFFCNSVCGKNLTGILNSQNINAKNPKNILNISQGVQNTKMVHQY